MVYANVWQTPFVVRIDPASGSVGGVMDFRPLVADARASGPESVLNGVAVDPASGTMFVTGKRWRKIYVVALEQ